MSYNTPHTGPFVPVPAAGAPAAASAINTTPAANPEDAASAVLRELGAAAGDNQAGGQIGDVPAAGAPLEQIGEASPPQSSRQKRAAETRARNRKQAEEEAALRAKELSDAGIAGSGIRDFSPEDAIPRDEDGNPLWYFNPKTRRVIEANEVLNRPDIRRRMALIPCQAPNEEPAPDLE